MKNSRHWCLPCPHHGLPPVGEELCFIWHSLTDTPSPLCSVLLLLILVLFVDTYFFKFVLIFLTVLHLWIPGWMERQRFQKTTTHISNKGDRQPAILREGVPTDLHPVPLTSCSLLSTGAQYCFSFLCSRLLAQGWSWEQSEQT